MSHPGKTKDQLLAEMVELRHRISELEKAQMEWQESKEKLIESEQNFRALVENANDGIMIAAGEGGAHVYANKRAAEITGYSVSELLETSIQDLVPSEDYQRVMARFRTILEGRQFALGHETNLIRKDGKVIPLAVTSAKIVWRDQPADLVLFRDVTEGKQAESALRESEARLRTVIESLPFDFFCIDKTGRYVMQNSTCRERWGDLLGKRPEDLEVDEETLALWKKNNRKAFAGEIVKGEVCFRVEGKKGYYQNIILPIHAGGEIQGILGVNIDISEHKRAEEALKKAHAGLERQVGEAHGRIGPGEQEASTGSKGTNPGRRGSPSE